MNISKRTELPKIIFFYGLMSLIALVWIYFAHLPVIVFGTKGLLEAYLLAFILFMSSLFLSSQTQWAREMEKFFAEILVPLSTPTIFVIALFSSVGEEMLFRGAVQNQFGFVFASVIFGLFHFPVHRVLIPWTISAMIMGFFLGSLYIYSGNLLAPITFHFLVNFLNLWILNQKYMSF